MCSMYNNKFMDTHDHDIILKTAYKGNKYKSSILNKQTSIIESSDNKQTTYDLKYFTV